MLTRPKKKEFFYRIVHLNFRRQWIRITGNSMKPILSQGDYVLLDRNYFTYNPIRRGDLVAFKHYYTTDKILIKRIIGVPGEIIEFKDSIMLIDDNLVLKSDSLLKFNKFQNSKFTLKAKEYFVLGDNLNNSLDSRKLGIIQISAIMGLIWLRLWPPALL